ncbi:DNA-processing protein DprA [Allokutzneria oryzae]|uniref:DNA-processing protein DprA n=1 Tax=Allokutzneria oryzae TaxID=1378989 RepID=A0ABV6A210_9PSEU
MVDRLEQAAFLLALRGGGRLEAVEKEIAAWQREGIGLVTLRDPDYPAWLRSVPQPPPFLTYRGVLASRDVRSVAVVGSRRPSRRGLARARDVASVLAEAGWTVVSGLGAGTDAAVHRGVLAAGARTVAVVGTGLRHCYPFENSLLEAEIARNGAVVSQFLPDTPPARHRLRQRCALMSRCAGVVVVDAEEYCEARVLAESAVESGRPVFFAQDVLAVEWAARMASLPGVTVLSGPRHVVTSLDVPALAAA